MFFSLIILLVLLFLFLRIDCPELQLSDLLVMFLFTPRMLLSTVECRFYPSEALLA
jgi:hypothetical protein